MAKKHSVGYDLHARCLLALVGMGDVNALRDQLDLGKGDQIDLNAYAYGLAGVENPEGEKILESMKDHEKKLVRSAVYRALVQSEDWNQTENRQRSFTSSLDQDIAKKGHLVHKLKAKDSTGRWAYYFVLIHPSDEQRFMRALDSTESIDLEDYGKVIASCYGETPNEKVKAFLKERYGFDV